MPDRRHPQQYDIVLKHLCERYPAHEARLVFDEPVESIEPLPTEEFHVKRREGDYFWQVTHRGKTFVLHLQFDAVYTARVPFKVVLNNVLATERFGMPVYSAVVLLSQKRGRAARAGRFSQTFWDRECHFLEFDVIRAWELDAEWILTEQLYGLYPLVLLTRQGLEDPEAMAKRLAAEAQRIKDPAVCADVLTASSLLGALVHPPELFRGLLKEEIMKESTIYQEIIEKGKREGLREGESKGEIKGKQEAVLVVLCSRFDRVSQSVQRQVSNVTGTKTLARLLDRAATCESLAEFRKHLPETRAKR